MIPPTTIRATFTATGQWTGASKIRSTCKSVGKNWSTAMGDRFPRINLEKLRRKVEDDTAAIERSKQRDCDHLSASGINAADLGDEDKIWRCDACGWLYRSVHVEGQPEFVRVMRGVREQFTVADRRRELWSILRPDDDDLHPIDSHWDREREGRELR